MVGMWDLSVLTMVEDMVVLLVLMKVVKKVD